MLQPALRHLRKAPFLALLLLCAGVLPSASTPAHAAPSDRVLLPATVTPDRYRLDITPDAANLGFQATVDIDLTVHEATDSIVLNSLDIVVDHVAIGGIARSPIATYDEAAQTLHLALEHPLKPGAYVLHMAYHGRIYQQSSGLFAVDYETAQGKVRALFTKFENSDARRFVPCWDEPGHKAVFELAATVPEDLMALSNTPVSASKSLPGGRKHVHFAPTPKMSTYLLFFGLGDFERVHRDVAGVDLGVVVKRGDSARAAFALDTAAQILPYYNDYFGVPYPLPRLDMIAGPGSSQRFGAMENWGAIFYFERFVLVDPRISTEADRQNVYRVIAHEMAHQWFGNLVTMAWWDDLWLNEGFASWMEGKAMDHFHPEWKTALKEMGPRQSVMGIDAREGTHPVITPIRDVLQAGGAFDGITYTKGAAVIRTLESFLGEEAFRAGVRRYMQRHAYGNTTSNDLWKSMDEGSVRPITRIAHELSLQAGVPLLRELSARCVEGSTQVRLVQEHFAIDPGSTSARVWHVPVTLQSLGGASVKAVVSGSKPTQVTVPGCAPVILNAGQGSYAMVRYADEAGAAISARFADLGAQDQLGILNDTASLALAGEQAMAALLDLARQVPPQADTVVLSALVGRLQGLDHLYTGLPTQARFRAYALAVINAIFSRVGWDKVQGESDNVALLRASLIAALGQMDEPLVLAEAQRRYAAFLANPASLDAGARRSVLQIVAEHADAASWDQLHALARSASTEVERQDYYRLLATARDPALVQQALALAISPEPPATSGPVMINASAAQHPELALAFAVEHWDWIANHIEANVQPRYVPRLLGNAWDLKLVEALRSFADAHIPPGGRQDVDKTVSNVRYLWRIRSERLPEVDAWLAR